MRRLSALVVSAGLWAAVAPAVASADLFGPAQRSPAVAHPASIAAADLDQDGHVDVLVGGDASDGRSLAVLRSKGDGTFADPVLYDVGFTVTGIVTGEFNGDGDPDVAVLSHTASDGGGPITHAGQLKILLGGTGVALTPWQTISPLAAGSFDLAVGNLDGNGNPDIVVTEPTTSTLDIFYGTGLGGSVTNPLHFPFPHQPAAVALADFSGDGLDDIATTSTGGPIVSVSRNNGEGTTFTLNDVNTGGSRELALDAPDVDGNGRPDLAVADFGDSADSDSLRILRNTGSDFAVADAQDLGDFPLTVAHEDFDGDGRDDVVTSESNGTAAVVGLNDRAEPIHVTPQPPLETGGSEPLKVAAGDVNGDGLPDVVTANYASDDVSALLAQPTLHAGDVLVEEQRLSGPAGNPDDYVELRNTTDHPVNARRVAINYRDATAVHRTVRGPAKVIPPNGHLLFGGPGYSLGDVAAPDVTLPVQIPSSEGVQVQGGGGVVLDKVGCTTSPDDYHEGTPLTCPGPVVDRQYAFVRVRGGGYGLSDSGDNANDFRLVAVADRPQAPTVDGVPAIFGAPMPESLEFPPRRPSAIEIGLLDPDKPATQRPNRRYNGRLQLAKIRRTITNVSDQTITHLRLRVVDIATYGDANPGDALLRLGSAPSEHVGGHLVRRTTLEEPPSQPPGGGRNSTVRVGLPPGGLAPGQSTSIQLLFHVDRTGLYRLALEPEPGTG